MTARARRAWKRPVVLLAVVASMSSIFTVAGTTPAYAAGATISTIAGDGTRGYSGDGGPATAAQFSDPYGIAVDAAGNVFVADAGNNVIRKINHTTGAITTVAGTGVSGWSGDGGPATAAQISGQVNQQLGVTVDGAGNLYISEADNADVRKVDGTTGIITTIVGTGVRGYAGDGGPATAAQVDNVNRVLVVGSNLYVSDYRKNNVRKVDGSGIITTFAGSGGGSTTGDGGPATAAGVPNAYGLAADSAGNIYIGQEGSSGSNRKVRKVDPSGIITTFAGAGSGATDTGDGGPATAASISDPTDLLVDSAGRLLIGTIFSGKVRRVDTSGIIHTIAGIGPRGFDGDGSDACFAHLNFPTGMAFDSAGNLYFTDGANLRVRKVTAPMPDCPTPVRGVAADFDRDFKADIAVFRPSSGTWFDHPSSGGADTGLNYGTSGDIPVPGDYDGDYITDQAVYQPASGLWAIHKSSGGDTFTTFGGLPGDIPVPADVDADGKTDLEVYRPSTGIWYSVLSSNGSNRAIVFGGASGDIPLGADVTGDGRADKLIFRPGIGTWLIHPTNGNEADSAVTFGAAGDIPIAADFDGDGKADLAVFRPSTGLWAVHYSSALPDSSVTYGGVGGDVPAAADYDGDFKADIAIFRPSLGAWYVHRSSDNVDAITTFGISGDKALAVPAAVRLTFFP